ncbi:MAG: DUF2911 domain-containing protein [Ferruginibacter sp.]
MKSLFSFFAIAAFTFSVITVNAQDDKSKRPSPPAKVNATTSKGATISIDYSQPSVKGRTIGKEIATYGEVWRTGANEATVFEVNKDVVVNGVNLKAGKYGLYSIPGEKEWTIILNKKSDLWGSDGYSETEDAVRVKTKPSKAPSFTEKMTFAVEPTGKVVLMWGDVLVDFKVD